MGFLPRFFVKRCQRVGRAFALDVETPNPLLQQHAQYGTVEFTGRRCHIIQDRVKQLGITPS